MNRFRARLSKADARINRAFAEEVPALLFIGTESRPVVIIFEAPDAPVFVQGGGEIQDHSPAFSAMTADLNGLEKQCTVQINGKMYRVTHIGTDEEGRTRVTLGYGEAGRVSPVIDSWS
ncbi:head-tail joining protein [Dryocola clanedunensis]|uniref:head-tail joining protein n=1 Tax=Cedecea sulfonylureivorans TaxID=3051154 RepID=UPI001925B562|nr:head-tail joining protein [Cedecea sulfonylureivorans]